MSSLTWDWILLPSSRISTWWLTSRVTSRRRSFTSRISRIFCFSSIVRVDHGGDDVGQDAGIGDRLGHRPELLGEEGGELDDPLEEADEVRHQRLDLDVLDLPVLQVFHAGPEVGLPLHQFDDAEPADPLEEELGLVVGGLGHPEDHDARADAVKILHFVRGLPPGRRPASA